MTEGYGQGARSNGQKTDLSDYQLHACTRVKTDRRCRAATFASPGRITWGRDYKMVTLRQALIGLMPATKVRSRHRISERKSALFHPDSGPRNIFADARRAMARAFMCKRSACIHARTGLRRTYRADRAPEAVAPGRTARPARVRAAAPGSHRQRARLEETHCSRALRALWMASGCIVPSLKLTPCQFAACCTRENPLYGNRHAARDGLWRP